MDSTGAKLLDANGYLLATVGVCLCSFGLMCACWYAYGELITDFYRIHVSEDFGKEDKNE